MEIIIIFTAEASHGDLHWGLLLPVYEQLSPLVTFSDGRNMNQTDLVPYIQFIATNLFSKAVEYSWEKLGHFTWAQYVPKWQECQPH